MLYSELDEVLTDLRRAFALPLLSAEETKGYHDLVADVHLWDANAAARSFRGRRHFPSPRMFHTACVVASEARTREPALAELRVPPTPGRSCTRSDGRAHLAAIRARLEESPGSPPLPRPDEVVVTR